MIKKHLTKILVFIINIAIAGLGVVIIRNHEKENLPTADVPALPEVNEEEKENSFFEDEEDDDEENNETESLPPANVPSPTFNPTATQPTSTPKATAPSAKTKTS